MNFAVAFTFAMLVHASADNCATLTKGKMIMKTAVKATDSCSGAVMETCGACCMNKPGICRTMRANGTACAALTFTDNAKDTAAATATTFQTACCAAEATCKGFTGCAAAGKKDATDMTKKCGSASCSVYHCCQTDTTKCAGDTSTAGSCGPNKTMDNSKVATVVKDFIKDCCKAVTVTKAVTPVTGTCAASSKTCTATTQFKDKAKDSVTADDATFDAKCCTTKMLCTEAAVTKVGATSSADTQHAPAMLLLLLVGGGLVLGK